MEFLDWFYHDHVSHVYEESPQMAGRFYPRSSSTPRYKALAERIPDIFLWDLKRSE